MSKKNIGHILALSLAVVVTKLHSDESPLTPDPEKDCENLYSLLQSEQNVWEPLEHFRLLESVCDDVALYNPLRAQFEAFVGNHLEALKYWDRSYQRRVEGQQDDLPEMKSEDAVSYIVNRSSDHTMIMVNERHHVSDDRLLTLSLLEPLFHRGYRYLAIEAMWPEDEINQRGYPTRNTGYYVNDVVFAEMLRVALSLGYEILGYEIEEHQKNKADSRTEQSRRDYWQARNLIDRTLGKDPDAKILVHCGWGHLQEQATQDWQPMAHFVRELAGIDPLTVDQTRLSERSEIGFEHPWRTKAEQLLLINEKPIVLLAKNGTPLQIGKGVDVRVLSPRTVFVQGRPAWMDMLGRRHPVSVPIPECAETTCIVEARDRDQPNEVAYDRIEAVNQDSVLLYLPNDINIEVLTFKADGELHSRRALLN